MAEIRVEGEQEKKVVTILPGLNPLDNPDYPVPKEVRAAFSKGAAFTDYSKTMTSSDLKDKFIFPLHSTKAIVDLSTATPLLNFARKMIKLDWEPPGDPIKISIVSRLTGSGVTEGTTTEGAEEEFTVTVKSLDLAEYAHATAWTRMAEATSAYNIAEAARDALKDWAARKIESLAVTQLKTDVTTIVRPNDRGSDSALKSTDRLDTATISKAKWKLRKQRAQGFRVGDLGLPNNKKPVEPALTSGFYVMVCPPELIRDLQDYDTDFKNAMQNAADLARGLSPWESDVYLYQGVLIVQGDPSIWAPETIDASYSYKLGRALMFGYDAFCIGFGQRPGEQFLQIVTEQNDLKRQIRAGVVFVTGTVTLFPTRAIWINCATEEL